MACQVFWGIVPSEAQQHENFVATFGTSTPHCDEVWEQLTLSGWIDRRTDIRQVHLLWTLFFLKVYLTNRVCAFIIGTSPKTFREKVWFILEGIAGLVDRYVSEHF